jgi:excisionase family DNA binding protein
MEGAGDMLKRLITTVELAEYLGVPMTTIYGWRQRGEGPRGFRVGRHLRYQPDDVASWLESRDGLLRDHVAV